MRQYIIEVGDELNEMLKDNARALDVSIENFIAAILNRYVVPPHIMEQEQLKKGYEECGDMNLDWANL